MDAIEVYQWLSGVGFAGGLFYILREVVKKEPSWMPTWFHFQIVNYLATENASLKEDRKRLLAVQEKQADDIDALTKVVKELFEGQRRLEAKIGSRAGAP